MKYILPVLHIPKKPNPKTGKEDWYIYYSYTHPITGQLTRGKERDGINRLKTKKEKLHKGAVLVSTYTELLKEGWTPLQKAEEQPKFNQDFYWWFEERIKYSTAKHGYYNVRKLTTVLNKLKEFSPSLSIRQLNYKFLMDFEQHLIKQELHVNNIADIMMRIKIIVNQIVRSGAMEYHKNPFLNLKLTKKKVEKKRITVDDIEKLEKAKLTGAQDLARDMYLMSFYCAGIRFGDLCRLKNEWIKDGYLCYTMHKTSIQRKIKIQDQLIPILKKYPGEYIFDTKVDWEEEDKSINNRNSYYNKELKLACKEANITEITFHTSRNSFADYAKKNNLDIHTLKDLLGHSKVATTEVYMRGFYQENSDQAMDKMFKK